MTALLMLFAEHRCAVEDLAKARILLASSEARRDQLESELRQARSEVRSLNEQYCADLRKVADAQSFERTRRNVFARSEAPTEPQVPIEQPRPRKVFARELAQQQTHEALLRMREELRQQNEPAA